MISGTDHTEYDLYYQLVAEMDALRELPSLTSEQAERWASLSGTRLALYAEVPGWTYKAVPRTDGHWELVKIAAPIIEQYTAAIRRDPVACEDRE